jgi:hypothetical protein
VSEVSARRDLWPGVLSALILSNFVRCNLPNAVGIREVTHSTNSSCVGSKCRSTDRLVLGSEKQNIDHVRALR